MASQVGTGIQDLVMLEFQPFIRGYHAYQKIWDPKLGDYYVSIESLPIARTGLLLLS